jgi:hypothetical protein
MPVGEAGQQHQIGLGVGLLCDQHRFAILSSSSLGFPAPALKLHRCHGRCTRWLLSSSKCV